MELGRISVEVLAIREGVSIPEYQTAGASGFDLRADLSSSQHSEITIPSNGSAIIPTGLAFAVPEGYEMQVRSRSGLAAKNGVLVLNSPGTVDADYRGEVKVILHNTGPAFTVKHGDRVAQAVISPVARAAFVVVSQLDDTARGEGGFGSTGVA